MYGLRTTAPIAWCPGCGNFEILNSVMAVLEELQTKVSLEKIILVSDRGNHGKIVDYLYNSFNSIHGLPSLRPRRSSFLPTRDNKVICFVGDGASYAEGFEHLIFCGQAQHRSYRGSPQ